MPRRGFALVELLVTTAMVGLVGAAVVAVVSTCLRVWQRVEASGSRDGSTQVAFQAIDKDLHNMRRFAPVGFDGSSEAMRFAAMVDMPLPSKRRRGEAAVELPPELGQVAYFFSGRHRALCRAEVPYRQLRRMRATDQCSPLLGGLLRARFSYYAPATETKEAGWTGSWESDQPPLAVKVEVQYDERTKRLRQPAQTLLIQIPLAAAR